LLVRLLAAGTAKKTSRAAAVAPSRVKWIRKTRMVASTHVIAFCKIITLIIDDVDDLFS